MTPESPTNAVACEACGAPLRPGAVCLACAFESALSGNPDHGPDSEGPSGSGFGDFAPPADGDFGKYRLRRELGSGGMGVIWEAEDTTLRRPVALKMIRGFAFSSAAERQRFQREATAVAQLDHPHIVPIYEVGEIAGQPYFAMKRLTGGTLAARLACGAMDHREAAAIMAKLACAIAHAHAHGILHRDLKPDNVLFDASGEPYLTDFGLAKIQDEGDGLTLTTAHVGTPHYMSPEQARGRAKDITEASDVWGAGALFFHMLTGRTPFTGDSSGEILDHVANDAPLPMDGTIPAVDKDLRTLCLRCLARDPAARLPGGQVLAEELTRWLDGRPIATKATSLTARALDFLRQRPILAALAVGLCVLGGVAVAIQNRQRGDAAPNPMEAGQDDRVLHYGDSVSLRNLASDEYLDTCGWVSRTELGAELATQNLFVFTSASLNRGDRPTGTWQIESATGTTAGAPLSFGDKIHLQSLYPGGGWLDNCGQLERLDFYDAFSTGQQNAVSTTLLYRDPNGSDAWIVRSPEGKAGAVGAGDAIVLETAFADGGHLNAAGRASEVAEFARPGFEDVAAIAFVSERDTAVGESGKWRIERSDGRAPAREIAEIAPDALQNLPEGVTIEVLEGERRLHQDRDHGVEVHVRVTDDAAPILRFARRMDFEFLRKNFQLEPKFTRGWFGGSGNLRSDLRAIHFPEGITADTPIWGVRSSVPSCWDGAVRIATGDGDGDPFFRATENLIRYNDLGVIVRVGTNSHEAQLGVANALLYLSDRGWLELCWTGERDRLAGLHATYFLPAGTTLSDLGLRPGTSAIWLDDVFGKITLLIQPEF